MLCDAIRCYGILRYAMRCYAMLYHTHTHTVDVSLFMDTVLAVTRRAMGPVESDSVLEFAAVDCELVGAPG